MRLTLFDFQKDALHQLRDKITAARRFASSENPQAIAFSAATGSGKTLVMTALFEAILDAPDDQLEWSRDWRPQPDAVILWVSDMPELNEQPRLKIESKSDRIYRVSQLVTIDASFDAERLPGGRIYFINTQKLGNDKRLTKTGDGCQYSVWTTLSNTAQQCPDRFYVVIDEAHRGMTGGRGAKEAQTLMQRFLLGYPEGGLVKMPLVIGVSATPKRFMNLLEYAPHTVAKTGGDVRPMFPDLVVVRQAGDELSVDILEPHDPSLADNFEKAVGLARFAERHGHLCGRIQLIRKQASPVGGDHFARLDINTAAMIKQLLPITSNRQLDDLFAKQRS
jgi:Type III restriction enzyme, res subunit